jgi:hypothetical protein
MRDDRDRVRAGPRTADAAVRGAVVALVGCWLVVAPFLLGLAGMTRWNDVVVGGLAVLAGGAQAALGYREPLTAAISLLGLWLLIAALVLPAESGASWNHGAVGVVLILMAVTRPARRTS